MPASKLNQYWTLIIVFLVAIIIIGGIVVWTRYSPGQPIEISMPPDPELQGEVYIGGAVANPGFYPLKVEDSIESLVQAAGGTTSNDSTKIELYITRMAEEEPPQKVDINRAEAWLLQALPGIGEVRAQAIIDYRQQNGRFHSIEELTKVEGIGTTTCEKIEHLITVAD
jgi:competence protein ComEA